MLIIELVDLLLASSQLASGVMRRDDTLEKRSGLVEKVQQWSELDRAGAVVHAVKRRCNLAGHVVSCPQQQGQLHAAVAASCAPIEGRVCGR